MLDLADSVNNVKPLRVKSIVAPDYFIFPCTTGALKQPEEPSRHRLQLDDVGDYDDSSDSEGGPQCPLDRPRSVVRSYSSQGVIDEVIWR